MSKASFLASPVKIRAIGLGGAGCNAINRMVRAGIRGVEFVGMNTDAQALALVEAPTRVQLGARVTRGLGAGGDHKVGQKAAEESKDEIKELVADADMVFIACGMGGGTGTGSAAVVAEQAKHNGALTIAVVTKPFSFEGFHRCKVAEEAISRLVDKVDTLIVIPNDRLLPLCEKQTGVDAAFRFADDVLAQGVQAISEVLTVPGIINLDFADIRAVMKDAGPAWMSIGIGSGLNRAVDAARAALASPLLDTSASGAKGVLFNIVGNTDLTLFEVNEAAEEIRRAVDPDANIIFGVAHDSSMNREVKITLVATGFPRQSDMKELNRDSGLRSALSDLKESEDKLDAPSFLRYPLNSQRRQVPLPNAKAVNTPQKIRSA